MRLLRRDALVVVLVAVAAVLVSRSVGWALSPYLVVGVVLVVLAVRGMDLAVGSGRVRWPEPGDGNRSHWSTLDPRVRRLARAADTAVSGDAPELRQAIQDEMCRRLVARHGADPADPMALARETAPAELFVAATTPGRIPRRQLDRVLDQLEEL